MAGDWEQDEDEMDEPLSKTEREAVQSCAPLDPGLVEGVPLLLARYEVTVQALEATIATQRALLRRVEWGGPSTHIIGIGASPSCGICGGLQHYGHLKACELAAALADKCVTCGGSGVLGCHAGKDGDCNWDRCPQEANNRANYQSWCPLAAPNNDEDYVSPPCPTCHGTGQRTAACEHRMVTHVAQDMRPSATDENGGKWVATRTTAISQHIRNKDVFCARCHLTADQIGASDERRI